MITVPLHQLGSLEATRGVPDLRKENDRRNFPARARHRICPETRQAVTSDVCRRSEEARPKPTTAYDTNRRAEATCSR